MRVSNNADQALTSQLVTKTKRLVSDSTLTLAQKISALKGAMKDNMAKIQILRTARACAIDEDRVRRIDSLIGAREKATAYLVATGKWLKSNYGEPRRIEEPIATPATAEEFPMMEFSS